jgi:succinyl-CoA synthetase beta subunit
MDLKEHEGRALLMKHGIVVPRGLLLRNSAFKPDCVWSKSSLPAFLNALADARGFVLKAQLFGGKRGKGGGIIFTDSNNLLKDLKKLRGKTVNGEKIKDVLVVEALDAAKEYYLAISVDRSAGRPVLCFSDQGGIDIEEIAEKHPQSVKKIKLSGVYTLPAKTIKRLASRYFKSQLLARKFVDTVERLFKLFRDEDCLLAEINPLILTTTGDLYAADAKITLDDNSIFRHPNNLQYLRRNQTKLEAAAARSGLAYVELKGDLAIIGNGAGLVMATLDAVKHYGAKPANFCDLGGGASKKMMEKALEIILRAKSVKAIFINIFGGITRCDEVARGIIGFIKKRKAKMLPMVVRLSGTNQNQGAQILSKIGIKAFTEFSDAARAAGKLIRGCQ